jgi:hypothetical protein
MHDDEKNDFLNRSDRVPSLLTVGDPFDKGHAAGILENELRRFKVDTVFRSVDLILRPIPFDSYPYLQCSQYDVVKVD